MNAGPALARIVAAAALVGAGATCASGANGPGGNGASTSTTTTTTSTTTDAGQDGCASPADCSAPPDACIVATCTGGVCGTQDAPQGTVATKDSPPNCHSLICDGMGHAQMGVDPTNVPVSSNPCLVGTCDATGEPGTMSAAAGVACSSAGGKLCDGNGNCVACLQTSDCPTGQTCNVLNACVSSQCMDETDVGCGGSNCPPCGTDKMCKVSSDCVSDDCSPLYLVCLSTTCSDGMKDGNESDVDCGGSCDPCATGKMCLVDQDCISKACDAASLTCVASQCDDHMKDGNETDVDCGGGTCPPCAIGQTCKAGTDCASGDCGTSDTCVTPNDCVNETDVDCGGGGGCPPCAVGQKCQIASDCVSMACDAIMLVCVSDHCFDHAEDGDETDIDCGGPTCVARCKSGQWCQVTSDCVSGLTCTGGVCQ